MTDTDKGKIGIILFFIIVPLLVIIAVVNYIHVTHLEGTVTDKYSKRHGKQDKFYIVVEQKNGIEKVISNEDSLLMMKFNSADLQANIKEGENYNFTLRGYRVPILSWFPNLDSAETHN
ncbi:hypothetical protein [Bacillus thuringiensis]|uniref:Uncharacterized protein n=1 Tax=Bacillus thuringiensis subsp. jegathesan TaxID=56955 RepID=A0A9X6M1P0_BACTJ|nr:hypothetical protein [Bacillus thuringiensis]OUB62274.1 hypothetical protein BK750_22020 [Bacillus thuringiensis serovar jegathesan]